MLSKYGCGGVVKTTAAAVRAVCEYDGQSYWRAAEQAEKYGEWGLPFGTKLYCRKIGAVRRFSIGYYGSGRDLVELVGAVREVFFSLSKEVQSDLLERSEEIALVECYL